MKDITTAVPFISNMATSLSVSQVAAAVALSSLVYFVITTLRNHFTHPLAKFPGPVSASFSNFTYCRRFLGGRQPYKVLELHEKYGPVVRTAPNELSFSSSQSWRDIYGQRKGHQPFIKSPFYDGGNFAAEAHSIVSVRDPDEHNKMRKYLSNAFSDRSLKEQEDLITEVVDLFIEKIGQKGKEGINMVTYFNLTTFDIIGSLAFGETFGGVKSGIEHFWVAIVISSLTQGALADCFGRFPLVASIFKTLFPGVLKKITENTKKHEDYSMNLVKKRINRKTDRKDFFARILENREQFNLSDVQLAAHASDFVIAGSETTATALACITYYLLRQPDILKKLQQEVRTAFRSYDQINAQSTASLKYLQAVALEGMRVYPPLPFALPRVVPPGGDTVDGHFIPEGTIVSTAPLAASMSSANFKDPWKFDPGRWIGQNDVDDLEASQPFSLGVRGCLGRSLGWMELRTILAKMHFKYDLELINKDIDWHRDSEMHTLWKKPELMVKVLPRRS
ncbi:benzoate 4-monooxygenase cytochrome P450 [Sphaerosporella brunnea]|uniref:Benzoate 4-monooxygenase cytochrome P450 n=1 Tax=Sphaerosporella brunnea TaxID=1250544 RepID=A0A5J5F1S9_9PEZI|nr:benzoate 4-monooxygenase cytochrome P450 [Sphaerosporella brunnea]